MLNKPPCEREFWSKNPPFDCESSERKENLLASTDTYLMPFSGASFFFSLKVKKKSIIIKKEGFKTKTKGV